ncbi:matrix-remodeling-associated protein 5 [Lates japonicus]|uniref:Matrix-remodeling-associated protein 5 n=2 Tax=Lates japonicus TaxID=270547 RepID=A0AAD3NA68_LATJO|nr:matrix-remodeling-associated protein 5 [Lates japonicus]
MDPPAVCVLQTLLVLMILPPVASVSCPRPCSCPQPTELHCTFRSLITIPAAVSKHVERMNLGFNSINKITDKSLTGLRKLELLMVHGNDINTLPDGVFKDLMSLQMLKISYNKLKEINRHTLQGLWSLARLHLDHNQLEFIHPDAFQGLTSLRLLQLEGNQLQQLHPATFTTFTLLNHFHISTLRHLYLSDNGLTSLPSRLVATMPQLENLYLHGNPWSCDCSMRWFHNWNKTSPGVLKCKKDKALPGGQLCPICSSPRHLQKKELQAVENLVCSSPVISSPHRTSLPDDTESEVMTTDNFREPFGNISLGLSDEHGNEVDLKCSIGEPREITKIDWEQVNQLQLSSNITLSVDLECPVDREKYEQLWRLIAYYSNVPAHLQRGIMLSKEPHPTYVYRQDSEKDALYYTGVKVNVMAQPAWLMQTSADLQLNRLQSSAKMVKLILSMELSETVEAELVRRQSRTWVLIETTNTTHKVLSTILGSPSQMYCNVHSSGPPIIQWMLPDGSKVEAPYSSPDNRVSVSSDGRLVIKSVSHTDTGIYYCIAKVHGDLDVLPFHLTVQESSSPPPGQDTSITPTEGFAGSPISLPCTASGSPDAEINWILPSNNIVSFQGKSSRVLVYPNGTLHIPQTQLLDSGYYKCIAMNQHGVDTLAAKITVIRRKGFIRPLRKFPARPQSASGVNTQIKVLTEDTEEASGDIEVTQEVSPMNRQDPMRRRIPGSVAPGRRGIHPSRNMWRRPPVLRKPTGSHVEDSRRRINVSKSKIDPEKWADILAKIRDRTAQNTVTPLPVERTTERKLTEQTTQSQETIEGSSDGVTVQEKEGQDYLTTPHTPVPHTQMKTNKHNTQGVKMGPLEAATQEASRITVNHSEDQQFKPIITTSEPRRISDYHPATQSPDHKLTSPALKLTRGQTIKQTATPAPTITAIQTNPFREGLLTSTQDVLRMHQLPGQVSVPRGKPRITKSNFQTFTVKVETDAQLPCEAKGEPKPFLSWTKVISGASIAQNTRVQRFEVHPNGTLIIRNTQLMDGGQYLCMVQNQYGTDKMVVNLVVISQHPRVLQPQNRDITVYLGGKVDLDCEVEGHPRPKVTWVLPNHVHMAAAQLDVPLQQRVVVLSNGTLQISQASYTDRGIYKCIGSSAAGADTVLVHLHVSALPPVIQQTQHENTTLPEGSTAYIHCTATGTPQPVISWITPDGVQLTASQFSTGRNLIVFPNGTLYIQRLGPGNAGRYECSASNAVKSSRRTVILSIRKNLSSSKASITSSSPHRTDVIYGSKLLLNCMATGEPDPWIIWRTPSKKLVDAQYSFDPRIKVFPNGTITIHSVTDKDSGDYLCVARNKMGDDYVLLRVNVLTRPAKIEQKQQRSSQEVVYGGDLKVDCVASGLPNPEISWALPDGTMVNPVKQREHNSGGRSRRYLVFDNGTLYFNDVGMPEEGDYTCYAENQLGKDEMKVRVKVKVATFPPQIQDKDQKIVRVFYGETVTLKCNSKGEPMPVNTWISPTNRVISPALDKYQVLDDGTLVVQKVQRFDGGNYTCLARNSVGQDHKVIRLEVLVTPPTINGQRETAGAVKVTAVQDQRKLVDCVAKGTPTPRVMWVLPGNVILPAPYYSKRMTVHQNGTLEIRSPKKGDSGHLACIARNEGGEVRQVVDLDVKEVVERPQIRGPKTDTLSLTVGNAMALNCSFEGSILPHVTWILPNGTPLLSGTRFSKFFHQPDGTLIISNPSVGEAGIYRCLGRNSGGFVERTITLSPGRKPEINNRYSSPLNVMNGETLLLHCQTNGEHFRLTWTLPSGVVLNRPQRAGRYSILPNGTLAIQQVSVYDRGSYVCRAANEYGSSLLSVSVIVTAYPPRITNGPPSVTYAKRGVAVQLNCIATGIPRVEVAWETPDKTRLAVSTQPRLFGNKYLHPQGSLIIQNPTHRDGGIYRCTARNAIGIDSKATFLNVF